MELTEKQKQALAKYTKVSLTSAEFKALPEYSLSTPTQSGSIGIKKWKHRTPVRASEEVAIWFLGEIKDGKTTYYHIEEIIE